MQLEGLQFSRSSVQSAKIALLMCEMARECEFVEKPCVLASTGPKTPGTMFPRFAAGQLQGRPQAASAAANSKRHPVMSEKGLCNSYRF